MMVKLSVNFAIREAVPALNNQSRARCYCFPVLYLCCCRFECCKAKLLKRSSSFFYKVGDVRDLISVSAVPTEGAVPSESTFPCGEEPPSLRRSREGAGEGQKVFQVVFPTEKIPLYTLVLSHLNSSQDG